MAFDQERQAGPYAHPHPLGLIHIHALRENAVRALARASSEWKSSQLPGYPYWSNPGGMPLAGQRHPFQIPRVQLVAGGKIS